MKPTRTGFVLFVIVALFVSGSVSGHVWAQETAPDYFGAATPDQLPEFAEIVDAVAEEISTGIGIEVFASTCLDSDYAASEDYSGGVLIRIAESNARAAETLYYPFETILYTLIHQNGLIQSEETAIESIWQVRFVMVGAALYISYNAPFYGMFYTWGCGDPDLVMLVLDNSIFQQTAESRAQFIGSATELTIDGVDVTASCILPALSAPGGSASIASPLLVALARGGLALTANNRVIGAIFQTSNQPVEVNVNDISVQLTVESTPFGMPKRYSLGEPVNQTIECGAPDEMPVDNLITTSVASANVRSGVDCGVQTTLLSGAMVHPVARLYVNGDYWFLVSRFEIILNGALMVDTEDLLHHPYSYISGQVFIDTIDESVLPTVYITMDGIVSVCGQVEPLAQPTVAPEQQPGT